MAARLKNNTVPSYPFQAAPSGQNKIRAHYEYELVNTFNRNFRDIFLSTIRGALNTILAKRGVSECCSRLRTEYIYIYIYIYIRGLA